MFCFDHALREHLPPTPDNPGLFRFRGSCSTRICRITPHDASTSDRAPIRSQMAPSNGALSQIPCAEVTAMLLSRPDFCESVRLRKSPGDLPWRDDLRTQPNTLAEITSNSRGSRPAISSSNPQIPTPGSTAPDRRIEPSVPPLAKNSPCLAPFHSPQRRFGLCQLPKPGSQLRTAPSPSAMSADEPLFRQTVQMEEHTARRNSVPCTRSLQLTRGP